jgi:uncharacterized damage-inducible protein DinB
VAPDSAAPSLNIPAAVFIEHWQGHRRVTRRVIEAFPDDQLFTFAIGGMRPFSALALELVGMASGMVRGIATRTWPAVGELLHHAGGSEPATKEDLLRVWDATTAEMNTLWPSITTERFAETDTAFGQYTGRIYDFLFYCLDNEVHHRGQGYVYLRALGVGPPAFYDRS